MRERISCGIDIGSTKVALTLLRINRSSKEIVFNDLLEHDFIKGDLISDLPNARDLLKKLLVKASKRANRKISSIFINAEGPNVLEAVHSKAMMPLNDGRGKIVSSPDINKLNNYARALASELNKEIIHQIPQYYSIDNKTETLAAKGLFARKVGVDLLAIRLSGSHLNNLYSLINSIGFDIDEVVYSGLALRNVFLDKTKIDESLNIIIDIGGNNTGISLYKNNILSEAIFISCGANILVKKVSENLKLPQVLSSEILKSYGAAFSKDISESENIVIKKTSQYQTIKRKKLVILLEPEVKGLLNKIKQALDDCPIIKNTNLKNIILTGRICLMDGLLETAEQILGMSVELGKSHAVDIPNQKLPLYAISIGLALCGAEQISQIQTPIASGKNRISRFFNHLKEIYQDYF